MEWHDVSWALKGLADVKAQAWSGSQDGCGDARWELWCCVPWRHPGCGDTGQGGGRGPGSGSSLNEKLLISGPWQKQALAKTGVLLRRGGMSWNRFREKLGVWLVCRVWDACETSHWKLLSGLLDVWPWHFGQRPWMVTEGRLNPNEGWSLIFSLRDG